MGGKSKDLKDLYEEFCRVVSSWQVSEFPSEINIVDPKYLLGKDTSDGVFLDDNMMAAARLK